MDSLILFAVAGHFGLLAILCVYGAYRLYLTLLAQITHKPVAPPVIFASLPTVTVQLPVFNERFVVQRLINSVAALRYPRERLQIQVLDDSTDETSMLAAERVLHHHRQGLQIEHIRRQDRSGFKAGALAAGLETSQGEFVAVFDADFLPPPDFLLKTIHHFSNPAIGMVQARWEHLNRNDSTLTRVQAILLDAHFAVEQAVRSRTGRFFNFNGTAGIWRKQAIRDAGGWHADTLTEDLDLSYRAQLAGWRLLYLPHIGCPAELPPNMKAFKSQQHRWSKGAIQVMKKLLPQIWAAPVSLRNKVDASFHLTSNICYLLMFIDATLFLVPSILARDHLGGHPPLWLDLLLYGLASATHLYFFLAGQDLLFGCIRKRLPYLPALMATVVGLGFNNSRAVVEALVGQMSGFVRTPKLGDTRPRREIRNAYIDALRDWGRAEVALGIVFSGYLAWAVLQGRWSMAPFMLLFACGFFYASGTGSRWRRPAHPVTH